MIRPLTVLLLFAVGIMAQTVAGPELLARIRQHLRPSVVELPNYTCLETMERTNYAPSGAMEFRERLHLDVIVAEANELFAWPGSDAFTAKPLEGWISGGAIFNGNFWIDLYNLFEASVTAVTFAGTETVDHHSLLRFDFHTPLLSSRSMLTIGGESAATAYSGSFWVDSDSLDIVRLETRAEEIPPNLNCRSSRRSVTYKHVRFGTGERLLPSVAELQIVTREGRESRDTVTFSDCRHYQAETTLSFDVPTPPLSSSPAPAQAEKELPPDVSLVLKLEQPVTIKDSAVGDPIVARLEKAVTKGAIRLPKGTRIAGRIRRLEEHFQGRQTSTLVALQFFVAQGPNGDIKFKAHLTGPRATPGDVRMVRNMPEATPGTPGLDIEDTGANTGIGSFRVAGKGFYLPRGFLTVWETQ
jgi:hypothetical protein